MALSANSDMKLTPGGDDDNDDERLADTARSSTGPFTRLLFIFVGAVVVLGGLWIGVGDQIMAMIRGDSGDVPTITADAAPIKVRPESPGGMQVPNQGRLVYGVVDGSATQPRMERLLPSPEKPVEVENVLTRSVPETNAVVSGSAPRGTADPAPMSTVPPASQVENLTAPPPPPSDPTVASANQAAQQSGAPRVLAPAGRSPVAETPPPVPTPIEPAKTVTTLETNAPPAPTAKPAAAPAPKPEPKEIASTPPAATASADLDKSFRVQLAAGRSEPAITSEWNRLKSRNTDLLGDLQLQVTKVDLGATKGIFYRLRAGPLENETAAKALCERLKQRKLGCLVIKPGA